MALFSVSLFFFYDLLGERYLLTERDLGPYFIPPRFFWVESLKRWDFPLWNPYQFSGHPFFANPQYAVLYPFNILFFLLPFDIAFNSVIILHFFLGGLFTYLFLRDVGVNSTGALISGLIFMLGGYALSVHSLLTILLSSIWTPLIMLFFRRAILRPGLKNEIFTAVFMAISFLGGGIEIVYGNFLVLLLMLVFSLPLEAQNGSLWKRIFHRVQSLFTVALVFVFLSAIQLFPFVELFYLSIRGSGISYNDATIWSFAPKDILLFFLPDAYGYFLDMKKYWVTQCWFKTLYTGGLPFILSLIFFLAPRRGNGTKEQPPSLAGKKEEVRGFGRGRNLYIALMVFSIFLSLGKYNPLYPLVFKYVPFFSGIRYPVKFLYIFIFALSVTAGLGFHELSECSKDNDRRTLKHLLLVFSLLSGFLLLFSVVGHKEVEDFLRLKGIDFPDFNPLSVNLHHAKRFLFYLALFFLLLRFGQEVRWKEWVKVLLLVFLTADLFGNMGFYGKEKTSDYLRKTGAQERISSGGGNFRVFSTAKTISMDTSILTTDHSPFGILKEKHLPSMNLLYRLHDIWGIDVIPPKRANDLYRAFTGAPSVSSTNLIDLYGVKYIVSVTPLEKDSRLELIYAKLEGLEGKRKDLLKENTVKLYENRKPILRGWLVRDFKVMNSAAVLSRMVGKDFRPDREVLLEEAPPGITPKGKKARGKGSVEFVSKSNNRLRLLVKAPGRSFLVLNDTYFPGWKAFVDGRKTKIYRADYAFRAILLDAGTHHVEFVYDPISFKLGAGATFLGIIGCVAIVLVSRRKKKWEENTFPSGL